MTEFNLTDGQRRRSITVVIVTVSIVAVTLGLTWPLLSLILEARGVSTTLIGLSTASQTLAVLFIMPLAPWMLVRFGTIRLIRVSIGIMIIALLLLPAIPNVYAWFPIRFLLGMAIEVLFIACDVWVNQVVEEKTRGRVIGIYGFVLAGGFAVGPLIINVTGIEGWAPFIAGAVIIGLGALPLAWAHGLTPPIEGRPKGRLLYYLRIAPTLMVAGLMYGLVDSSILSFLPIYGLGAGFDQATVVTMLTVLIVGSVAAQLPLGWAADHVGGRQLIIGCTVFTLIPAVILPFTLTTPWAMWAVLLVWGAALGGFYTISMVSIGRRFKGADLVAVNAAFVVFWGLGAITGPAATGGAIELWGFNAMPMVVAVCCLLYLPLAIMRLMGSSD
ncbi:MAG: MFS transporter [Proteobacteria bacterium]|nr:MFS transporter [Pseudomonadota bacterium]